MLEKTNWPGGMAATKELFKGYKHSVGAWALLVFRNEMLKAPASLDSLIAEAPDARTREILLSVLHDSAMGVISKFFPDPEKHRHIQGSLSASAIDGTHM